MHILQTEAEEQLIQLLSVADDEHFTHIPADLYYPD
jgi:hypothetical protein